MLDKTHDYYNQRGVCKVAYASDRTREILRKRGLWDYRSTEVDMEVNGDPFDLSIDKIQVTSQTGGADGGFAVSAFAGCRRVASFTWRYALTGDDENWMIFAEQRDPDGTVRCAEAAYGKSGGTMDNISKDSKFVRLFTWMVREQAATAGALPDWAGNFSAAASQYSLITIDDCVSCDTPFCNC